MDGLHCASHNSKKYRSLPGVGPIFFKKTALGNFVLAYSFFSFSFKASCVLALIDTSTKKLKSNEPIR
jgi:hypothetical protein